MFWSKFIFLFSLWRSTSQTVPEDAGVVVSIRSPIPGQIWDPAWHVQVHLNCQVETGWGAEQVRADPAAFQVCYWGGQEPPICKPILEGTSGPPQHFTESSGKAEIDSVLVIARAGTIGTVEAWLQRFSQPANPRSALGTVGRVLLWSDPEAASMELRGMLNRGEFILPHHMLYNHLGFALKQVHNIFSKILFCMSSLVVH